MLQLLVCSVLAQVPTPISAPLEKHVIILTGGTDAAEGKARLDAITARAAVWKEVLGFAPILVDSAQVPGLKPGFHVVLWGVCDGLSAADESTRLARAVEPGAYSRPLTGFPPVVQGLPCPHPAEAEVLGDVLWAKGRVTDLRVAPFQDPGSQRWRAVVTLVGKAGGILEERVLEQRDAERPFGNGCTPAFAVRKGAVVIGLKDCALPRGCPTPASVDGQVLLTPGERRVDQATQVLRKTAPPCAGE
jgi:hypothetical protein